MDCLIVSDNDSFEEPQSNYRTYTIDNLISLLLGDMKKITKDYAKVCLTGDLKSFQKWRSAGCSFKLTQDKKSISCKAWMKDGLDPNTIATYENLTCIVTGQIMAEHYYQHQFVLNVHNILVKGTETYTNKLKDLCENKGYFKNKKIIDWANISNLGIISKKNRQGYDDFINQFRIPINQEVQQISLDGANTCRECIRAIEKLQHTDLIVIIRGGGDTNDISGAYDDIKLFDAIKQSKIPIVTAIGHQQDKGDKLIITQISDMDFPTPTALAKDLNNIFLTPIKDMIDSKINEIDNTFLECAKKTQDRLYINLQSLIDSALKSKFKGPIVSVSNTDDCIIVNMNNDYFTLKLSGMKKISLPKSIIMAKDNLIEAFQNRDLNSIVKYLNLLEIESDDLVSLLENACKDIKKIEKYESKYEELLPKQYKRYYLSNNLNPKTLNDYLQIKSTLLYYSLIIRNEDSPKDVLLDILKLNF